MDLVKQGAFDHAEVLDMGCSIGDNAIFIAKHAQGAKVTAFDFVSGNKSAITPLWAASMSQSTNTPCLHMADSTSEQLH